MSGGTKENVQTVHSSGTETNDNPDSGVDKDELANAVSSEAFDTWYQEREYARNIRDGTPVRPTCAEEGTLVEVVVENPVNSHPSISEGGQLVSQGE